MSSEKAQLIDSIQNQVAKGNWKAAVADMEKLFSIDPDPIIRVRIGDAYQKLNQLLSAVKEYVYAADLYALKGVVVKALAQYKLALRLDPKNQEAQIKMASLHSNKTIAEKKAEPVEEGMRQPSRSVIPLFSGMSPEEFDEFTKMMVVHTLTAGHPVVKQGDTGKSVYLIATGSVKVWTRTPSGERLDLAVLGPSDFFGEISFLTGNPRTATVETAEESVILEVTDDKLSELVLRRPKIMQRLREYSDMRSKGTSEKLETSQNTAEAGAPEAAAAARPKAPDSSEKSRLIDSIQKLVGKSDWKGVIAEMEKLFAIDADPIIRVRIGDAYQKLNRKPDAVKEYMRAADMYAGSGAVVKALAQYKLALRLDPNNKQAQERIEGLHSNRTVKESRPEPVEQGTPQKPAARTSSVIPLFAGFSQEEFNAFTRVMNVHPLPAGLPVIEQHDKGKSVYIVASGSVKVYTKLLSGEQVDLAVLGPSDFFGEMSFLTGKSRTATVETVEDSVILEVSEDKLREVIEQRPKVLEVLQTYYEMRTKGTVEKILESNT